MSNASGPTAFITAQNPGRIRNNYTGLAGMAFTVGASPLTVTSLGHYGSFSGGTSPEACPGQHRDRRARRFGCCFSRDYCAAGVCIRPVSNPVTLQPNTEYLLLSQETAGDDVWFDYGPVTPTGVATVNGPAYADGSTYNKVTTLPGQAHIPVNFTYPNWL